MSVCRSQLLFAPKTRRQKVLRFGGARVARLRFGGAGERARPAQVPAPGFRPAVDGRGGTVGSRGTRILQAGCYFGGGHPQLLPQAGLRT